MLQRDLISLCGYGNFTDLYYDKEYELEEIRKKFEIFKIKHSISFIAGLAITILAITILASARSTTRYADASRPYG